MAFLLNSLNINLPLICALSIKSESQFSVPFQKTFFISAIAAGLECESVLDRYAIDSSMFAMFSCTSAKRPFLFAQSLLRHFVASIANALNAAVPNFLSTAGPTTNGPMPTASSNTLWRFKQENLDVKIPSPEFRKPLELMELGKLLPNQVSHDTRVGY